jgi:hypothetical protein
MYVNWADHRAGTSLVHAWSASVRLATWITPNAPPTCRLAAYAGPAAGALRIRLQLSASSSYRFCSARTRVTKSVRSSRLPL